MIAKVQGESMNDEGGQEFEFNFLEVDDISLDPHTFEGIEQVR